MDPSAGLPAYWTERTNAMSERDMALGGVAARSFSARGAYGDGDEAHKTSEQVGEYWMKRIESERAEARDGTEGDATGMSSIDWERRARARWRRRGTVREGWTRGGRRSERRASPTRPPRGRVLPNSSSCVWRRRRVKAWRRCWRRAWCHFPRRIERRSPPRSNGRASASSSVDRYVV